MAETTRFVTIPPLTLAVRAELERMLPEGHPLLRQRLSRAIYGLIIDGRLPATRTLNRWVIDAALAPVAARLLLEPSGRAGARPTASGVVAA